MKTINILFVDDEQHVLRSLKRTMLPTGYQVLTANSSMEALNIFQKQDIDILVSDIKMTDMDGVDLLKHVKKNYPSTHRMILSGYIGEEHVLKAILNSTTFDYLSKPWENEVLIKKIQHIVKIREILAHKEMRLLVNDIEQLPIIPEIYQRFEKAVEEMAPIEDISKIIGEDAGMSSKVLQLANTAFYSTFSVNSIQKAVTIIGLKNVKQLMFASIFLQESNLQKWQIDALREMGEVYARTSKFLNAYYYYCYRGKMRDDYNVLGFTFDIGKLILLRFKPEYYKKIMGMVKETGMSFYECEVAVGHKGASHREIGGYFLNLWNFSRVCIEASIFHHQLEEVSEEFSNIIALLDLAYQSALENESGYLEAVEKPQRVKWSSLNFQSFEKVVGSLNRIKEDN